MGMPEKRVIPGGAERAVRERKRTARRLLETPEEVTRDEARRFMDWIREDFRAFERRQQLRAVPGTNKTRTTRRSGR
jgi:hypothetical protein